jgi:hypothetical protein
LLRAARLKVQELESENWRESIENAITVIQESNDSHKVVAAKREILARLGLSKQVSALHPNIVELIDQLAIPLLKIDVASWIQGFDQFFLW